MEIMYAGCCGLDVHAKTVVACLCVEGDKQMQTFSTMTADLLPRADWLLAAGCSPIAIESTGVSWLPVFNLLEDPGQSHQPGLFRIVDAWMRG